MKIMLLILLFPCFVAAQSLPKVNYNGDTLYGLHLPELYTMCNKIMSYNSLILYTDSIIKYTTILEKKLSVAKSEISDFKQLTDSLKQDKSDLEAQKLNLLTVLGERDRTIKKMQLKNTGKVILKWVEIAAGIYGGFKLGQAIN